jgi:hypothetical protein
MSPSAREAPNGAPSMLLASPVATPHKRASDGRQSHLDCGARPIGLRTGERQVERASATLKGAQAARKKRAISTGPSGEGKGAYPLAHDERAATEHLASDQL